MGGVKKNQIVGANEGVADRTAAMVVYLTITCVFFGSDSGHPDTLAPPFRVNADKLWRNWIL
jgi:hypothetical protein